MDIDVAAKHHQVLQRDSFSSNLIDVILAEVCGIDDCITSEYLFRNKIVG
jgi:hypothetical protein